MARMRHVGAVVALLAMSWWGVGALVAPSTSSSARRRVGEVMSAEGALYDFTKPEAAAAWERIDDVVMGGVSSSKLTHGGAVTSWAGTVRLDGGGFCGARTAAFEAPVDLSACDGVYVDAALVSDADTDRRAWKLTIRCESGRGEVVHSAEWVPPVGARGRVRVPLGAFRLVRGPRLVPGAPPLDAAACDRVFGFGMTISKFGFSSSEGPSEATAEVANFRDGPFKLELYELGVYSEGEGKPVAVARPAKRTQDASRENSGGPPVQRGPGRLVFAALRPVAAFVFSEKARRRKQARTLLVRAGKAPNDLAARLRGQRVIKRGVRGLSPWRAAAEGLAQLARDAATALLALPLRLAFRALFTLIRAAKKIRGDKKQRPMPALE